MRRFLFVSLYTVVALIGWTTLLGIGMLEGWWHRPVAPRGDTAAFASAAHQMIDRDNVGNAAFALVEHGKVVDSHAISIGAPVDDNTLFQMASVSKWVTSFGVMHLVEQGKLDLDAPVDRYLTRWHLPKGQFDNSKVTIRRLLSHTAGLTDGLGYKGYEPTQRVPTIEQELAHTTDAMPMADGHIRVGTDPGTHWQYSGGGFLILQLVIEEVTHRPFNDYMRETVLAPFGMSRSTYVLGDTSDNVAVSYETDGKPALHYTFTASSAAGLYSSTHDLAALIGSLVPGPKGEPAGRGVVKPSTLAAMRDKYGYQYGMPIWGLGTILYAPNNHGDFIIGHEGGNYPAINTSVRLDPATGDGIVVLETGAKKSLAGEVGSEWVFWKTGNADLLMVLNDSTRLLPVLAGGALLILLAAIAIGWFGRRRSA